MSPRYIPSVAEIAPPEGTTEADRVRQESLDRFIAGQGDRCTDAFPYTDGTRCRHSWFADLGTVAASLARSAADLDRAIEHGGRSVGDQPDDPSTLDELAEARKRLATLREPVAEGVPMLRGRLFEQEARDLTTSTTAGGEFVPGGGGPLFILEAFGTSAVARASLFAALPKRDLPRVGMKWEVPVFSVGAAVAVQASENSAVQETDPETALASSNRALIAGQVDFSRQLFDLTTGFDSALAAELGQALGAAVDAQLVAGTNANGQTRGLMTLTGINAVAYTDASPTAAELLSKIWEGYRLIAEAGAGPGEPGEGYLVLMAPRRAAWMQAAFSAPIADLLPGRLVTSSGVRLTEGAGTNEDEVAVIARDEVFVGADPPRVDVHESVGSNTLTVRVQAMQYVASMFARRPKAISRVSGTGLAEPTL